MKTIITEEMRYRKKAIDDAKKCVKFPDLKVQTKLYQSIRRTLNQRKHYAVSTKPIKGKFALDTFN